MISRAMLAFIRFYRLRISPNKRPSCRFTPSCSEYALEAIRRYGAFRGGVMSVYRLLRCNPFCAGGYDPVPTIDRIRDS